MEHYDILIVGAGAAGIAAAKASKNASVLLVDQQDSLGGILLQCAHRGFGRNQTGPEYIQTLLIDFPKDISCYLNTTVLSISKDRTAELVNPQFGRKIISFQELILATGCLEVPIGALPIAGTRPGGIYTAGQMQKLMNLHDMIPEGPVVILGSGDLGLIMAEHLAKMNISVTLVEKRDTCGGMSTNQRCLKEYPINLICNTTIAEVHGSRQVTGVTLENGCHLPCNTLLIAAGLKPNQELTEHLGHPDWLHLCGNCSTIHSMVTTVTAEGKLAGETACEKTR